MTEPLSDRLLEALGDPIARGIVRLLAERELSQAELIKELGVGQSTASRAVKVLRASGLVAPAEFGRGVDLAITAGPEALNLLLAADRLAERVLEQEDLAQKDQSLKTRKLAIKPAAEAREK